MRAGVSSWDGRRFVFLFWSHSLGFLFCFDFVSSVGVGRADFSFQKGVFIVGRGHVVGD